MLIPSLSINLPPVLRNISKKEFSCAFFLSLLDKIKVGGDSCLSRNFANKKHKMQTSIPKNSQFFPPYHMWDTYLLLIEFTYNNNYHSSIRMAPLAPTQAVIRWLRRFYGQATTGLPWKLIVINTPVLVTNANSMQTKSIFLWFLSMS